VIFWDEINLENFSKKKNIYILYKNYVQIRIIKIMYKYKIYIYIYILIMRPVGRVY
jgi:hypothetical protein